MHFDIERYDDLREVYRGSDVSNSGLTFTGIARNEMHFLPIFLREYRKLGVQRFIIIDDASSDGSVEFLASQPDVILVSSDARYGDAVKLGAPFAQNRKHRREITWRNVLLARYGIGRWTVHHDLDEFVSLPEGMTLQSLIDKLEALRQRMAWGVMLDVYPRSPSNLPEMQTAGHLDLEAQWYFDGKRHLSMAFGEMPKTIYGGSRARLLMLHGMHPRANSWQRRWPALSSRFAPSIVGLRKPFLAKWDNDTMMLNSHTATLPSNRQMLLPLRHFKFNAEAVEKIRRAAVEGQYFNGSAAYKSLDLLLSKMVDVDAPFTCGFSRPVTGYEGFAKAGVAFGL